MEANSPVRRILAGGLMKVIGTLVLTAISFEGFVELCIVRLLKESRPDLA